MRIMVKNIVPIICIVLLFSSCCIDFFSDNPTRFIYEGTYICQEPHHFKIVSGGDKYKDDEILWKYNLYGEIEIDGEMVEFIGVQTAGRGDLEFWTKSYVIEKDGKDYEIKSEDAIFIGYSENLRDGSVRIKNSLTGEKFVLEKVD